MNNEKCPSPDDIGLDNLRREYEGWKLLEAQIKSEDKERAFEIRRAAADTADTAKDLYGVDFRREQTDNNQTAE